MPRWRLKLPEVQEDWGALLPTLEGHSSSVLAVAFTPDGKQLASASRDNTIKLWDASTGAALQTLEGHSNWVWAVAYLAGRQAAGVAVARVRQVGQAVGRRHGSSAADVQGPFEQRVSCSLLAG